MGCVFLYNPKSGKGNLRRKIGYIRRRLEEIFGDVKVTETGGAEDMAAQARRAAERGEPVVFAGGDGTFNTVLGGVAERNAVLGYIPAGTVNDAAGNLKIPRSVRRALNVIARGRAEALDCLQINEKRYAFCIVAAGSLTRVTYETPQRKKRAFGWFAYAFEALKRISRVKPLDAEAECGGKRVCGPFALMMILNGKRVARLPVNRGASMRDGLCEAVLVRQANSGASERRGARRAILRLFLFGADRGKRIVKLRGEGIKVDKTDSVMWDLDGERGPRGAIDVRVVRGAVKIFVP